MYTIGQAIDQTYRILCTNVKQRSQGQLGIFMTSNKHNDCIISKHFLCKHALIFCNNHTFGNSDFTIILNQLFVAPTDLITQIVSKLANLLASSDTARNRKAIQNWKVQKQRFENLFLNSKLLVMKRWIWSR